MVSKITLALAVAGYAFAAQANTLQEIRSSGAVTMGVREASGALPYSLGDKDVGFHVDLCQRAWANPNDRPAEEYGAR